jgi:holliday junction DNA helicase RuvA
MLEFISGKIEELTPTAVVLDNHGLGYYINISLNAYAELQEKLDAKLLLHEVIREDTYTLYGFLNNKEREVFRLLVSVSGIGANTARMMLSKLSPAEIEQAILNEDVNLLKSIKGIGLKSAQRVIVDLKDKIKSEDAGNEIFSVSNNTSKEESLSALVMLGFPKNIATKVVDKIILENPKASVEEIIKVSLNRL